MLPPKKSGARRSQKGDDVLIFDVDDTFHFSTSGLKPLGPSSIEVEPSTSHTDWDICMARLGPAPSRSPTPEIDVVHPPPPRRTALLETKLGFFLNDNTYISHWECCQCHKIHPITDKNKRWRSRHAALLKRPREADAFYTENCATLECMGVRCNTCFDLDLVGYRRQYCNFAPCEWKKALLWLAVEIDASNLQRPREESSESSGIEAAGTPAEEFPVMPKKVFPLRPW